MDSQSVVSGPQPGERGFDGNKKIKGVKRHVLTCSLGFVLAILVTAANVHDTRAAELLLDRAVENGFVLDRVKVDGIYVGPAVRAAEHRHKVDFQVSTHESKPGGFAPLPLRWRLVVAHEIVDVMQQRLRSGEVGVAQQIDVEVRHGHRINAGSHGVGYAAIPAEYLSVNGLLAVWPSLGLYGRATHKHI